MISLKKHIESSQGEVLRAALDSYRRSLAAMANSTAEACPHLGKPLKQILNSVSQGLTEEAAPAALERAGAAVEARLGSWGRETAEYLAHKAQEVKEIILILVHTADELGKRDQRYSSQLEDFTARLETVAGLDDLTLMRQSLVRSATELRSCVLNMTRDGGSAVAQLRAELTEYQTKLEETERLALVDPLTQLDSRVQLERHLQGRAATGKGFCVMVIDLNGFKPINDTHGHLAGDELLKLFAIELKNQFRPGDVVGRWGGDEFLAIAECTLADAHTRTASIKKWACGEYTIKPKGKPVKVEIGAAIGVTHCKPPESPDAVVQRADAAMYKDKAASR
ncbi:MAG: GGDEF domain-containing protein [Acidimicrobiia bacterium]|nr:GGDEF domain-containing protein [Acidimicrobiia bacterium]